MSHSTWSQLMWFLKCQKDRKVSSQMVKMQDFRCRFTLPVFSTLVFGFLAVTLQARLSGTRWTLTVSFEYRLSLLANSSPCNYNYIFTKKRKDTCFQCFTANIKSLQAGFPSALTVLKKNPSLLEDGKFRKIRFSWFTSVNCLSCAWLCLNEFPWAP